jgi:N-acetylglucosamine kinase-like BadF-type ATPase
MAVGWGEPVGAGGLVREALHAIAAHHQGVGPATVLTAAFLEASRFASVDAMFEALSRRQWRLDPALAPVVDLAAQAGDACAVEILTDSGRRHAEMAVAAAARVGLADDRFELVLAGSVHAAAPTAFAEAFAATVRAGSPGAVPTPLTRAPALGAVQLALDSLRA